MNRVVLILFILIAFNALQCKKSSPESQLPPITTSGANTFGCLVNGKPWVPGHGSWDISWGSGPENKLGVSEDVKNYGMNGILIEANYFESNATTDFYIDLRNISTIGTYKLPYHLISYGNRDTNYFPFDTFAVFNITRCDTTEKIISGTFSFIGYTDSTRAKSATISDGRFDLHYPLTMR